jgi:O-antigen ligase
MNNSVYFKLTYWGILSVAFGVFISVSVPSLFHILTIVPAVLVNLQMLKEKKLNLPLSAWVLLLIILLGLVSNIVNFNELNDPVRSFGKLKYFLFAVLSIGLFREAFKSYIDSFRIKKMLNVFFFSVIIAGIYGVITSYPERAGGFTGIMRYGYGMSLVITILLGVFLHRKQTNQIINKKFFYMALIFGGIGLLMSQTRGAFLGLMVSIPVVLALYKIKYGVWSGIVIFLFSGMAAFVIFSGGSESIRYLDKLGSMSNLKRLSQYETSLRTIADNPWVGVGVNNFSSLCSDLKDKYKIRWQNYCDKFPAIDCSFPFKASSKKYCSHSHNIVMETAVNIGVLGGLLLILWGIFWIIELWNMNNLYGKLLIPFVVNVFVAGQFENIFDANNSFMIFLLYPLSFIHFKNKSKTLNVSN